MIFKVKIEEIQRMTVEIEAESAEEAEQIAEDNHWAGEYDLDESNDRECSYECERVHIIGGCATTQMP